MTGVIRLVSPQPTVPLILLPPAGSPFHGVHLAKSWLWYYKYKCVCVRDRGNVDGNDCTSSPMYDPVLSNLK